MAKRINRYRVALGTIAVIFSAPLALYCMAAVILSRIPSKSRSKSGHKVSRAYVSNNGVHMDIVLDVNWLTPEERQELKVHEEAQFVAFGWGDKGFYLKTPTWAELKPSVAVKAMCLPSPTAMHVTAHHALDPAWRAIELCEEGRQRLMDFIYGSFEGWPGQGISWIADSGYGETDEFFEAQGSYSALYTCNTWVNHALKIAWVQAPVWSPWPNGVWRHLDDNTAQITFNELSLGR